MVSASHKAKKRKKGKGVNTLGLIASHHCPLGADREEQPNTDLNPIQASVEKQYF
jgi:hypothetical protein